MGNVINENGSTYTYDKYGRLLTSNYNEKNKYTYDNNGNLSKIERLDSNDNVLSTTVYNRSASNSYKLTSVTGDINATLSYGSGFNPTNITINGVSRNVTYEGKRIKTYGNNTYFYNEEGIRVKKVSEDGYTKEYILEGNKILCEKILKLNNESNTYSLIGQLFYHYDLHNELVSVENEGNIYFYVKDLLGVIHKIVDINGNTVVQYIYDSWGKLINSYTGSVNAFVAQYNPFIYKSYYYDKETKLYYLNSRFYSPELKQFLTIDDINYLDESLGNMNLFSYCNNNPIMYYDPSGHSALLIILAVVFIVDTIVETTILMTNENYEIENVFDGKNVEIPNSAYFNNPIAQYIYSSYLYNNVKKEDESNYFEGNKYDIMGEWQAHNAAYWGMKVVSLFSKDFANSLAAKVGSENYEIFLDSAKTVNLGGTIDADGRDIVELVSSILSDINEKYFGLIERTIYILCNINF